MNSLHIVDNSLTMNTDALAHCLKSML